MVALRRNYNNFIKDWTKERNAKCIRSIDVKRCGERNAYKDATHLHEPFLSVLIIVRLVSQNNHIFLSTLGSAKTFLCAYCLRELRLHQGSSCSTEQSRHYIDNASIPRWSARLRRLIAPKWVRWLQFQPWMMRRENGASIAHLDVK